MSSSMNSVHAFSGYTRAFMHASSSLCTFSLQFCSPSWEKSSLRISFNSPQIHSLRAGWLAHTHERNTKEASREGFCAPSKKIRQNLLNAAKPGSHSHLNTNPSSPCRAFAHVKISGLSVSILRSQHRPCSSRQLHKLNVTRTSTTLQRSFSTVVGRNSGVSASRHEQPREWCGPTCVSLCQDGAGTGGSTYSCRASRTALQPRHVWGITATIRPLWVSIMNSTLDA